MNTHCGCCGRPCVGPWCEDCRHHIIPSGLYSPWDRTWYAQHDEPCPFQLREDLNRLEKLSGKDGPDVSPEARQ
jgi:hypothetical protein